MLPCIYLSETSVDLIYSTGDRFALRSFDTFICPCPRQLGPPDCRVWPFSPRPWVWKSCKILRQGRKNDLGATSGASKGRQLPEIINKWRFLQQIRVVKAIQNYYIMHLRGAKNCDEINLGCAKAILCSLVGPHNYENNQ